MSDDEQYFREWSARAKSHQADRLTPTRLAEMFAWTTKHGPTNNWTGATGHAAAMIRELLRERIHLVEGTEEEEEIDVDNL